MLSQIENDLAVPSMKTLEYLAATLGVSVSWLLADEAAERLPPRPRAVSHRGSCRLSGAVGTKFCRRCG